MGSYCNSCKFLYELWKENENKREHTRERNQQTKIYYADDPKDLLIALGLTRKQNKQLTEKFILDYLEDWFYPPIFNWPEDRAKIFIELVGAVDHAMHKVFYKNLKEFLQK